MKKIGNVQIIKLIHRPSVFVYDEISYTLIFNRIIPQEELQRVIGEIGKEASDIRNVRAINAQCGDPVAAQEFDVVCKLIDELTHIYNNIDKLSLAVKNGSGTILYKNTEIKFVKPRVVEFPNA